MNPIEVLVTLKRSDGGGLIEKTCCWLDAISRSPLKPAALVDGEMSIFVPGLTGTFPVDASITLRGCSCDVHSQGYLSTFSLKKIFDSKLLKEMPLYELFTLGISSDRLDLGMYTGDHHPWLDFADKIRYELIHTLPYMSDYYVVVLFHTGGGLIPFHPGVYLVHGVRPVKCFTLGPEYLDGPPAVFFGIFGRIKCFTSMVLYHTGDGNPPVSMCSSNASMTNSMHGLLRYTGTVPHLKSSLCPVLGSTSPPGCYFLKDAERAMSVELYAYDTPDETMRSFPYVSDYGYDWALWPRGHHDLSILGRTLGRTLCEGWSLKETMDHFPPEMRIMAGSYARPRMSSATFPLMKQEAAAVGSQETGPTAVIKVFCIAEYGEEILTERFPERNVLCAMRLSHAGYVSDVHSLGPLAPFTSAGPKASVPREREQEMLTMILSRMSETCCSAYNVLITMGRGRYDMLLNCVDPIGGSVAELKLTVMEAWAARRPVANATIVI
nr:hypothetical protein [Salmonid herpesvirus 1]